MAFGVANQSLPGRGPTPGLRLVGYAVLSITLMFLDRREGWMEQVHYALQTATYPLQLAVSSPAAAWGWVRESVRTRDTLRAENTELRTRLRDLQLRTMRYEALSQENARLRGLSAALPPVAEKWLVAEIVHVELDNKRPSRVLINRGASNGVFKGQAVMDDDGILGQTTHVGAWSAEVILINDPEHEIPVQIERTGVRTIADGRDDGALGLPYLPANADIVVGDTLITSGMGGVFPQGYPVAKIVAVHREAVRPLDQVLAMPLAHVDRSREVMLVWFRDGHPAAPSRDSLEEMTKGVPSAKPQPVPPKPKAPSPTKESEATNSAAPAGAAHTGTATPSASRPGAGPRQTVPTPAPSTPPARGDSASSHVTAPAKTGTGAPTSPAPRAGSTAPAAPRTAPPSSPPTAPAGNRQ